MRFSTSPERDLRDEIRRLVREEVRLALELRSARRLRDQDDLAALEVVARSAAGRVKFSSKELVAHARVDPELQAALENVDCDENPRCVGRLLRRCEGRAVGALVLGRVGADRDGIVWQFDATAK